MERTPGRQFGGTLRRSCSTSSAVCSVLYGSVSQRQACSMNRRVVWLFQVLGALH